MKRRFLIIALLLSSFMFLLISCVQDIGPEGVSFEEDKYIEQKTEWEKLGIKNYSFDYDLVECEFGIPSWKFHVTVVDGVGSINLYDYPYSVNPFENQLYYIDCIEDLFARVDTIYKTGKQDFESGKYIYVRIDVNYNFEYSFPEYVYLRCETKEYQKKNYKNGEIALGPAHSDYHVVISNFKVDE